MATHQREVWRYLRFLGASTFEADDLTQETFLEVWRKPFEEITDRSSAAYLRTVARNRFLMGLRKANRRPVLTDLDAADTAWVQHAGNDGGDDRVAALRLCLEALADPGRQALRLIYGEERRSREDVAKLVDLKPEGLKTLIRRNKLKLRECVERRLRQEERP